MAEVISLSQQTLLAKAQQSATVPPEHPMVPYLHSLFEPGDTVCIWLIRQETGEQKWWIQPLEQIAEPGTIQQLEAKQAEGWNVYVCMNPLAAGSSRRLKDNVAKIRSVFLDIDDNGPENLAELRKAIHDGEIPQSTFVVESSPNKYYVIWRAAGFTKQKAETLYSELIRRFGADKAAKDCSRVLKVPGFVSLKYQSKPVVRIIEQHATVRYTPEDFSVVDTETFNEKKEYAPLKPGETVAEYRNNAVRDYAFQRWVFDGCTLEELKADVYAFNEEHCIPPLPKDELDSTVLSSTPKKRQRKDEIILSCGVPIGIGQQQVQATATLEKAGQTNQELIDQNFPAYDGKPPKAPEMLIDGFLMRGVNFFGSLSGIGKSWAALAVAKSLTTSEPLFGVFPVKQKMPVLYLIPESDEASFKYRLGVIGMTQNPELFRFRTISQGKTLSLVDELTLAAIRFLHHDGKYPHVLVIVDTAIRFMVSGSDMKSATNNTLSNDAEILRSPEVGADILFLHHSPKAASKSDMTLENVLRDTGDFGAMADAVYGLRRDEKLFDYGDGPEEVEVINVKMRAPERPKPFRVRLKRKPLEGEGNRPISVIGGIGGLPCVGAEETSNHLADRVAGIIAGNPTVSLRTLKEEIRLGHDKIKQLAKSRGWEQRVKAGLDSAGKASRQFYWSQITFQVDSAGTEEAISLDQPVHQEAA